jgi:hypothetical protein
MKTIAVVLSLAVAGMAISVPQALANKMNGQYGSSDAGRSQRAKQAIRKGHHSQNFTIVRHEA